MTFPSESQPKSPFRQAALTRLNNPEQLDRLLTVTTPRSWIAFTAFLLLIAVAVGWAVFGTLSTHVSGTGLFLKEGGRIVSAAAPGPGTLAELLVRPNEAVEKGQVVARLVAPDVDVQLANAEGLVVDRQTELDRQRTIVVAELKEKLAGFASRRAALLQQQTAARQRAENLSQKLSDDQELLKRQLVTRTAVLQTQAQLDQAMREADDAAGQISQIISQEIDANAQADQRIKSAEYNLAEAQRRLTELQATSQVGREVLAPISGTIDAIEANLGGLVTRGQSVLTIEAPGAEVELVLFVPVRTGGDMLEAGETVSISPNWTTREEHGTMLGEIYEVSKFPVTPEGIRMLVANEELVRSFSAQGPTYVAHVRLKRDPGTVSGYAWTSDRGAEQPIGSGGFATADVLVKEERPIAIVIPALRRFAGI